jgi:hypothetical protein
VGLSFSEKFVYHSVETPNLGVSTRDYLMQRIITFRAFALLLDNSASHFFLNPKKTYLCNS